MLRLEAKVGTGGGGSGLKCRTLFVEVLCFAGVDRPPFLLLDLDHLARDTVPKLDE